MNALVSSRSLLLQSSKTCMRPKILPTTLSSFVRRHYTPLTDDEIAQEVQRVSTLSNQQKDLEVRQHNRDLARIELLKSILDGTHNTLRGRYQRLTKQYGLPMLVWYWVVWTSSLGIVYGAVQVLGIDGVQLLQQVDGYTGWQLTHKVDPQLGTIGLALLVNEVLEPIRLPVVLFTTKPVVDQLFPPKY